MSATLTLSAPSAVSLPMGALPFVWAIRASGDELRADVQDALADGDPGRGRQQVDRPGQDAPGREDEPGGDHDDPLGAAADADVAAQAEGLRLRARVADEEGAGERGEAEGERGGVGVPVEHERDRAQHEPLAD